MGFHPVQVRSAISEQYIGCLDVPIRALLVHAGVLKSFARWLCKPSTEPFVDGVYADVQLCLIPLPWALSSSARNPLSVSSSAGALCLLMCYFGHDGREGCVPGKASSVSLALTSSSHP